MGWVIQDILDKAMVVSNGDVGEQSEGGSLVVHGVAYDVVEEVKADISLAWESRALSLCTVFVISWFRNTGHSDSDITSVPSRATSIVNLLVYLPNIL